MWPTRDGGNTYVGHISDFKLIFQVSNIVNNVVYSFEIINCLKATSMYSKGKFSFTGANSYVLSALAHFQVCNQLCIRCGTPLLVEVHGFALAILCAITGICTQLRTTWTWRKVNPRNGELRGLPGSVFILESSSGAALWGLPISIACAA